MQLTSSLYLHKVYDARSHEHQCSLLIVILSSLNSFPFSSVFSFVFSGWEQLLNKHLKTLCFSGLYFRSFWRNSWKWRKWQITININHWKESFPRNTDVGPVKSCQSDAEVLPSGVWSVVPKQLLVALMLLLSYTYFNWYHVVVFLITFYVIQNNDNSIHYIKIIFY
jgi:hypothetical protein